MVNGEDYICFTCGRMYRIPRGCVVIKVLLCSLFFTFAAVGRDLDFSEKFAIPLTIFVCGMWK